MPIRSDALDSWDDDGGYIPEKKLAPKYLGGYVIDPPSRPKYPPLSPPVSSGAGYLPGGTIPYKHSDHIHWVLGRGERLVRCCTLFQAIRNRLALWIGGRGVTKTNDCY